MGELRGDLNLVQEPLGPERGRKLGFQNLDRDPAVVLQVLGEVDRGHPAAAEFTLDRVAPGEGGLQTGERASRERFRRPTSYGPASDAARGTSKEREPPQVDTRKVAGVSDAASIQAL